MTGTDLTPAGPAGPGPAGIGPGGPGPAGAGSAGPGPAGSDVAGPDNVRVPQQPGAAPLWSPAGPAPRGRTRRFDLAVAAGYLLLSVGLLGHLLRHAGSRILGDDRAGQLAFEGLLERGGRVLSQGANPLHTGASGLTVPLAPVTLWLGAPRAYALLAVLALAATATSWYALLARHLVASRPAAVVGGWLCAFAPGLVAQVNGHPELVAQFLVPWLVWGVFRLREPGRTPRKILVLALLVAWQYLISREVLLLTALVAGVLVVGYLLTHRATAPGFAGRLAVAGAACATVLGYPLWVQGLPAGQPSGTGLGVWAYVSYARESLAGDRNTSYPIARDPVDQLGFFGWGLPILVGVLVWWLRRTRLVVGLAATAAGFAVLSFGATVTLRSHSHLGPGPWALVRHLPPLDHLPAPALALAVGPLLGVLLALGCDRFLALAAGSGGRPLRLAGALLLVLALAPIAPTPLPAVGRPTPAAAPIAGGQVPGALPAAEAANPDGPGGVMVRRHGAG